MAMFLFNKHTMLRALRYGSSTRRHGALAQNGIGKLENAVKGVQWSQNKLS